MWQEEDFRRILLEEPQQKQRTRKILAALDGMNILRAQELLKGISDSLLFIRVDQNPDGSNRKIS